VKKHVERSSDDPSVVITTYEGQHCHHTASTVAFQRGAGAAAHHHTHSAEAAAVALAEQMPFLPAAQRRLYNSLLPPLHPQSSPPSSETAGGIASASLTTSLQQHLINGSERVSTPSVASPVAPATSVEKGLLDDIVPHGVRHG
jgi:hypothetical protein